MTERESTASTQRVSFTVLSGSTLNNAETVVKQNGQMSAARSMLYPLL